uniref:Uncharacterized protein n=1 Tax=Romanomermis culicivorax TaxID=13658 RepID=A0A915I799_ROMCU
MVVLNFEGGGRLKGSAPDSSFEGGPCCGDSQNSGQMAAATSCPIRIMAEMNNAHFQMAHLTHGAFANSAYDNGAYDMWPNRCNWQKRI